MVGQGEAILVGLQLDRVWLLTRRLVVLVLVLFRRWVRLLLVPNFLCGYCHGLILKFQVMVRDNQ